MEIEKLLNEHKDKILRFEVYENFMVIYLKDNGRVEVTTGNPFFNFDIKHIINP
jgi:hypothetical protein